MFKKKPSSSSAPAKLNPLRDIFTSDLSVNEFLLVREAGFEPIGMVMGCAIYDIGYPLESLTQTQEITILSQVMYKARDEAAREMQKEAHKLKAHGIVGTRLEITRHELGEDMAEFIALGTAIRANSRQPYLDERQLPFISDLSGQDFWLLLQAGYRPGGMVMGNCVYHLSKQDLKQFKRATQNVEMSNYTTALYDARELAMSRMQSEATRLRASGIVCTAIKQNSHNWGAHIIEFFSIGTAITPLPSSSKVAAPIGTILLND